MRLLLVNIFINMENNKINNSNYFKKFKHITTRKQYIDLRTALEKSMILFFAYDDESDINEFWDGLLNDISELYPNTLEIIVFNNSTADDKLKEVIADEDGAQNYPCVILCHPHIFDPQIFHDVFPSELNDLLANYDKYYREEFEKERDNMFVKIKKLLASFPVIVFIKGTPQEPFCKFSTSFIEEINKTGIDYRSFNIFIDDGLRCWLRLYSGWRTYPQLYINGKIIGGLDVMRELISKGELLKMVPEDLIKKII
jgi:Grx4 family monothiol glutaredoxin